MSVSDFNSLLEYIGFPQAALLDKPLYKKMFLDQGGLDATDKKALKDDVEKIRWLYTLKPTTINIAAYSDEERDYPEVAMLHIELSNIDRAKRINQFVNKTIPYPLVIFFTAKVKEGEEGEVCEKVALGLTDKRNNLADKSKWVLEENIMTEWIYLQEPTENQLAFIDSLKLESLSFKNFFAFYQSFMQRLIALKSAEHSGNYRLDENDRGEKRLNELRELEKLEQEKLALTKKLKKEKQMGKKIELNTQVKKINDKLAELKACL